LQREGFPAAVPETG